MDEPEVTRRMYHMEKEMSTHSTVLAANAESMKNLMLRSDERLDYIKERFDGLQGDAKVLHALLDQRHADAISARRRLIGAATSIFLSVLTALWFVVVEPVYDRLAVLDRRMLDAEKRIAVASSEPDEL